MIPRCLRILSAILIASATTCATSVLAQGDHTVRSGKVVSFAESENVNELYVAIMGEVDTPGTYRVDSNSLKLHHIIHCARGFTADASMAIRVIRPGRIRQTEIFSEKTDSPLMPGDLLIVESKRSALRSGKIAAGRTSDFQTIRANYEEGTIRAGIQIALLNVLDYPLVLRLRPDQANASYLVQALGQPISLLANTRIITPDVPGRQTSDFAKRATRMDDGSVIVFEPCKVNRNRLPVTLPKPFDGLIASGSTAKLISVRHHDLRNLGQHPFWSSSDPFDSATPRTQLSTSTSSGPLAEVPDVLDVETDPAVDSDSVAMNSQDVDDSQDQESITGQDDAADDSQSRRVPIASSAEINEPLDAEPVQFSIHLLIIVFLVIGALFSLALALRLLELNAVLKSKIARVATSSKNETQAANQTPALQRAAHSSMIREIDDEPSILAMDEHHDGQETITIPIRPGSDFGSRRSATIPPVTVNEANPKQQPDAEQEPASTPLARALLQLEQRRSA